MIGVLYASTAAAFLERARARKVCLGVHHSAMSPQLIELYGHLGLDYVIVSTEVESLDKYTLENLLRAGDAARTVPIVKLLRNDPRLVEEALNAGAPMVMVPHVTTRAELDAAVFASRFSPLGSRGLCPVARYTGYGASPMDVAVTAANERRSVIPIIEDRAALGNLDELMASPDVDIFEIGPFDLSQSLGLRPELSYGNPEVMAVVERVGALARKHGKSVLAPLWLPKDADTAAKVLTLQMEQLIKRGVNMFYGIEVLMLARVFREWLGIRELAVDA